MSNQILSINSTRKYMKITWKNLYAHNRGLKPLFQGETKGAYNSQTRHFDNEKCFFKTFLLKKPLLRAYNLKFNWSNWIVLIKSEFLITAGQE